MVATAPKKTTTTSKLSTAPAPTEKIYKDLSGKVGMNLRQRYISVEGKGKRIVEFSIQAENWVNAQAWGELGTSVLLKVAAEEPVFVRGYEKKEQWEDKETGEKRSKDIFVVTKVY